MRGMLPSKFLTGFSNYLALGGAVSPSICKAPQLMSKHKIQKIKNVINTASLQVDPPASVKLSDDSSPGQHLECSLMTDFKPEPPSLFFPKFLIYKNGERICG